MGKIKVLIADDNVLAAQLLQEKLRSFEEFELLNIAKDGLETIELIEKEKPNVVLLDIIMPKLDGIGVLEYAKTIDKVNKPIFIVLSAVSRENYISRAMNLGADYYIIKPFDEAVIASRIIQLYTDDNKTRYTIRQNKPLLNNPVSKTESMPVYITNQITNPTATYKSKNRCDDELRTLATKYMREYGLRAHMTGYGYIRDIVMNAFDTYCQTGVLPKGIYREIAVKNDVTIQKVERAIRNCIENVLTEQPNQKKPTNSQVICQLIEKIRINN